MNPHVTWLLVIVAVLAVLATTSALASAAATGGGPEDSASAVAIDALIDEPAAVAADAVPAEFESVMGYRPKTLDGLLVDPHGGCSSPVPLPVEFSAGCAEHDLGYDLLRYAELTGDEVGGWARTAIDDRLHQRMRTACAQRGDSGPEAVACAAAADTANAAVQLNSIRQFREGPEESLGSLAVSGVAGGAVAGALAAGWVDVRRRRRVGVEPRLLGTVEEATP
jgi:hypothetical protein